MKVIRIILPFMTVATDTTSTIGIPAGPYRSATKADKGRGWFEMRGRNGLIEVALGFQSAFVDDAPTDHVGAGDLFVAFKTVNQVHQSDGVKTIASATDTKRLIRPVWYMKLTSGSTLATACVGAKSN